MDRNTEILKRRIIMSVEENKSIVRSFYESIGGEGWVRRIREAETEKLLSVFFSEYYAPNCFMHATEGDRGDAEDWAKSGAVESYVPIQP
jgi:hypothetical protein